MDDFKNTIKQTLLENLRVLKINLLYLHLE